MRPNTLVITVGETTVIRNIIRTEFLASLLEDPEIRVILVAPPEIAAEYAGEFVSDRVNVVPCVPPHIGYLEKILMFFERNAFTTGTNRIMQHRAYENGESRIPPWVKQFIGFCIGHIQPMRSLLRFLELRIPPCESVREIFTRYRPDLLFSTLAVNSTLDVPLLREARRHGIRTVAMVRGWDNLTTYGILRVLPDLYVAQNDFLREQAIALHDIPDTAVSVVGTPDFDKYSKSEFHISREEFCRSVGIDPRKQIILYAAIGDFLFPKEGDIADMFERLIDGKKIPESIVLFRAHPAFESPLERMKGMRHVIPDRNAEYRLEGLQQWDMKAAHTVHLINSIRHAAVVVSAGSTMLIESALMERPTIAIAFEGASNERYWFSVGRWSDMATHIVDLLRTKGVRAVWNAVELAKATSEYLENPAKDMRYRQVLVNRFAGPNRGSAAVHLARLVRSQIADS